MSLTVQDIARMIDHAVLLPTATLADVEKACHMGVQQGIASVCVRPSDVPVAVSLLSGSQTRASTVIGFPHGTTSTAGKTAEAEQAIAAGVAELDMVLNIGRLLSGDLLSVEQDIAAVCRIAHEKEVLLKVILETCYLSDEQKIAVCNICTRIGVDFVKTSTGFGTGGATLADVCLMRAHVPPAISVKASGGIRDLVSLLSMYACGATRIGTSSTEKILTAAAERAAYGKLQPLTRQEALSRQAEEDANVY